VLVVSKRKYFGLYESNDLHALMDGHDRAFARLEGCAHQTKYDSQKPVVLRWEGQQPIYNPRFLAFSSHYEFRPLAVRRGHPNDKPRISFTLDSTLDSVNKIEQTAEQYAQRAGFDEDTIPHIAMAVREAAVNAVLHGNAYDVNKHITASFETTSDDLVIRIVDQGPGLDPSTLPDPLAPENILRGSGRGIFLIRAFMDEVNFRQLHPGTELTLIKHRTPAQSGT